MKASLSGALGLSVACAVVGGCNHQARHHHTAGDVDHRHTAGDVDHRREPAADIDDRGEPSSRAHRAAARSIADARCEREQRCNNIGPDAKFASRNACDERIRADWAEELNAYECPGGVNQEELTECLEDIRDEDCKNPFDTLARTMACSRTEICEDAD